MTVGLKKEISLHKIDEIFNTKYYVALYQHSGLNPNYYSELKGFGESSNLKLVHVKNSLARKVLQNTTLIKFSSVFEGPCVVVYTNDEQQTKALYSLHKKFDKLYPVAGILRNSLIAASYFETLSSLQSLDDFKIEVSSTLLQNLQALSQLPMIGISELNVKSQDLSK